MAIRQRTTHADTSVFGGVFDPEFSNPCIQFFELVDSGICNLVISTIVVAEILPAPANVRSLLGKYVEKARIVEVGESAEALQSDYISYGAVVERASTDALHAAIATLSDCDLIVSWSIRDIVNRKTVARVNEVNAVRASGQTGIFSPQEAICRVKP